MFAFSAPIQPQLNIASTSSSSRSVAVLIKKKDAHVLPTPKASMVLSSMQLPTTEVCGAHYESPRNKHVLVMAESSIGLAIYGGMNAFGKSLKDLDTTKERRSYIDC